MRLQGPLRRAQDYTATAQGCLLIAQLKTAAVQGRNRKWHFVRSLFMCEYCGIRTNEIIRQPQLSTTHVLAYREPHQSREIF